MRTVHDLPLPGTGATGAVTSIVPVTGSDGATRNNERTDKSTFIEKEK